MDLVGKVCVVTGGSSGIGKATCELFARLGAKVCICDLDVEKGEALASELNKRHGSGAAIFHRCDTTDIQTIRECFEAATDKLGYVDVLFNNAGIWDDSPKGWSRQVDINFKGPMNGCAVAIEYMGTQNGGKGGTVISTSSLLGVVASPIMPIYSATKAAVLSLTRCFGTPFHYELNKIRFMCICPHGTGTNLFKDMEKHFFVGGEQLTKFMQGLTQDKAFQTPENVAEAVVHALKNGENGSAWYIEADKEARLINIQDMTQALKGEQAEEQSPSVVMYI